MTYQPRRVQRKRTKGWRTPLCGCGCGEPARYVGRGSRWGNPWRIKRVRERVDCVSVFFVEKEGFDYYTSDDVPYAICGPDGSPDHPRDRAHHYAVLFYEENHAPTLSDEDLAPLCGHDLMCWCPLDQPCHADVLLEEVNKETLK